MEPVTETDTIVARQLHTISPSRHLPPPNSEQSPSTLRPFQFTVATFGTQETSVTFDVASASALSPHTSQFRHAQLIELHARIFPHAAAVAFPTTISYVWVPSNSTATATDILQVYGGQQFVIGGPLSPSKTIVTSCSLDCCNPVIKDSTTYNDTPRLIIYSPPPTAKAPNITATLVISGKVRLSAPLLQSSRVA